ncbi:hypothetical protein FA13DRAFT_1729904 [Coprinellus micaceus]|uniref:NTF2-domain-containing protein n=1 Tax=Coprinellus micaceus TaxID=71717 RepID=A0A4Y7TJS0_COPMI|nr:hypothetical protein FA13DRAFT_1729904 [Coprinellus micaceus]
MTTAAPPSNGTIHQNVVPSEVGWQFVPQYYTFVNKEPHRLHCFYNKSSTFIHGTEGEESKPCFGQQEIHKKITSIGFQDCKVFIHSVDAQASANGGIVIQVIGEMSNRNEPWRKFVQTFFLAEQPNGYFVLNDIFRFLKEETVEGDDASEAEAVEVAVPEQPAAPVPVAPEPVAEPPREPTPPPAPAPEPEVAPAAPVVNEPPTNDVPEIAEPAPEPEAPAAPEVEKPAPTEKPEERKPSPAPPAPAPAASPAPPAAPPAAPAAAEARPQAAPSAPTPSAPRSWASLAASNQKKWGSVAQESRGITETPASPAPSSGTQTPQSIPPNRPHPGQRNEHPSILAAQSITTASCFIKGVTEPVSQTALTSTLTQRFGPIKEVEIVRSKACAFLEFQSIESAKRAIIASLHQGAGGEGGVFVDGGDAGPIRIYIETKKERGDRPPPSGRPRGGPPVNGDGRGGVFRGRGGPRGRGAPPK